MITHSLPISIRDRRVEIQFDDGLINVKLAGQNHWWYIRPPQQRGPIERQQMRLQGMRHEGVYASIVHTATVSYKRYHESQF